MSGKFENLIDNMLTEGKYTAGTGMVGKYARGVGHIQPLMRAARNGEIEEMRNILQGQNNPEKNEIKQLYRELLNLIRQAEEDGNIELKKKLKKALAILLQAM